MKIDDTHHGIAQKIDSALRNLAENSPRHHRLMKWHPKDTVCMSNRLRRAAGRCKYWTVLDVVKIEFSESIFSKVSDDEKNDTVIHELAHAICFRLGMDKGHGPVFKSVCRLMGGTGNRLMDCQQDVVKRNLVKRWVMAKASEPEKIHIRTRKDAELFKGAFRDAVLLGVIQVDVNTKQVKWVQTATVDLRSMNPLEGKFELVT